MKSFRIFFLLTAMMLSPVFFTSCSDDDDEKSSVNEIVGTWKYQDNNPNSYVKANYSYTFTASGRYTWSALSVKMESGTYTVNGKKVLCVPDGDLYASSTLYLENGYLYDPELDIEYQKQ